MWGSSTFNTRIERLWLEVGTQFARGWRAFFYRLEQRHLLDRSNKTHLWLLHHLFLDEINSDCMDFQETWNAHPITGEGHGLSPNDMYLLGQLEHGVYDDCEGWTLQEIEARYGVEGHVQDGTDEEVVYEKDAEDAMEVDSPVEEQWEDELTESIGIIEENEGLNIRHEPIHAPESNSPFNSDVEFSAFKTLLFTMKEEGRVPIGYGLLPDEWDAFGSQYQPYHDIPTRNRGQELRIDLPHEVWHPRAVLWAQGLMHMEKISTTSM
ncbi:hypothetical protein BKA70DRAFT_1125956 [Coprinopsis sp. MPI-PUGE-AT-0042]|nr:hypothetical protein BKA70DRAFT_1125956 [Coprinopsis sp. MPI-PUGE-AT-0042]